MLDYLRIFSDNFFMEEIHPSFSPLTPEQLEILHRQTMDTQAIQFIAMQAWELFKRRDIANFLGQIGFFVNPADRALGFDNEQPFGYAYIEGLAAGAGLALKIYPNVSVRDISKLLDRIDFSVKIDGLDEYEAAHRLGSFFVEEGFKYLRALGIETIADDVEEKINDYAQVTLHVKSGVGMGFGLVQMAHDMSTKDSDVMEMRKIASRGVNWDIELDKLLGND